MVGTSKRAASVLSLVDIKMMRFLHLQGRGGFHQLLLRASPPIVETLHDRMKYNRSLQALTHLSFKYQSFLGLHLYSSPDKDVLQHPGHLPTLQTE